MNEQDNTARPEVNQPSPATTQPEATERETHGRDSLYSPKCIAEFFAEYVECRKFPWTQEDADELARFMAHIQERAYWEGQQSPAPTPDVLGEALLDEAEGRLAVMEYDAELLEKYGEKNAAILSRSHNEFFKKIISTLRGGATHEGKEEDVYVPMPGKHIGTIEGKFVPAPTPDVLEEIAYLRKQLSEWEENEAKCCPEDVGFVEYIAALEKKLAERSDVLGDVEREIAKAESEAVVEDQLSSKEKLWFHIGRKNGLASALEIISTLRGGATHKYIKR
jgi:hypothetical protein